MVDNHGLDEMKTDRSILDIPELARYANKDYHGSFNCGGMQLTSLEGAPSAVDGDFSCSRNQLVSLAGAPVTVNGMFFCHHNRLITLEGAPTSVSGGFFCEGNRLMTLSGAPLSVGGPFYCDNNRLMSLAGAPASVGGGFFCDNNQITSLFGAPPFIGGDFYCYNNKITSLKDIHHHIKSVKGSLEFSKNPIKSHVLGVLLIKGVTEVFLDNKKVQRILNRHLPSTGIDSILAAQAELMDAGLDEYAEL